MAHPDLDRLVDFSLRFARGMLEKRGQFYPFAASADASGEVKPLNIHSGEETPNVQVLIDQFSCLLRTLAINAEAVATAICYDGRVSNVSEEGSKRDAIVVTLEHSNGESVIVYLPYKKKFFGGYSYGSLIATPGQRKHFSQDAE